MKHLQHSKYIDKVKTETKNKKMTGNINQNLLKQKTTDKPQF
jgi:hypothetical protein